MSESDVVVSANWLEDLRFEARARGGESSLSLAGGAGAREGEGVTPMEALLCSLAGCTGMDVISILQKKRQQVTGFCVEARGTRASEHPRKYIAIELVFVIKGVDISSQAVERSIELSQSKYCGATASLCAPVTYRYRIEDEAAEGD